MRLPVLAVRCGSCSFSAGEGFAAAVDAYTCRSCGHCTADRHCAARLPSRKLDSTLGHVDPLGSVPNRLLDQ